MATIDPSTWALRAAFLDERALPGAVPVDLPESPVVLAVGAPVGYASAAAAHWGARALLPPPMLDRRLAQDGLRADDLQLLVESRSAQVGPDVRSWVPEVLSLIADGDSSSGPLPLRTKVFGTGFEVLPFSGLLGRWVRAYQAKLTARFPDLPESLRHSLLSGLATRLATVSFRTLVLELNVARVQGLLDGDSAEGRYQDYDRRLLADPDYLLRLFDEYPVLGRLLVGASAAWLRHVTELIERLARDRQALAAEGILAADDLAVVGVELDCGDPHGGGRTVCLVHLADGSTVVYKPRPLAAEGLYQLAVARVNRHVHGLDLAAMRTLPCGDYGWCEFARHEPCPDRAGVQRFYRRAGAVLATLLMLGAHDCHLENVVAAGEQFLPIDLEVIQQHSASRALGDSAQERASALLNDSVLAVGALPMRVFGDTYRAGLDLSSLGGGHCDDVTVQIPMVLDPLTDLMRIGLGPAQVGTTQNRPFLSDGTVVDPMSYETEVQQGFWSAYQAMVEHRAEFEALLRASEEVPVRHLIRPTRRYAMLLSESYHPDQLRSGLAREQVLDRLWLAVEARPELTAVVGSEKAQLAAGDIPCFRATAAGRHLMAAAEPGEPGGSGRIDAYFAQPSGPALLRRLGSFGPTHLRAQQRIIADTLRARRGRFGGAPAPGPEQPMPAAGSAHREAGAPGAILDLELTRSLAVRLFEDLREQRIDGESDVTWIGIGMQGVREDSFDFRPLGSTLYDGLAGMGLAFGYAGQVLDDDRYREVADRCARTLTAHVDQVVRDGLSAGVGAFSGLSGVVYALDHLATMTGDEGYAEAVRRAVPLLVDGVAREVMPDVVGGVAGAALVVASLRTSCPAGAVTDVLTAALDRLLTGAVASGEAWGWSLGEQGGPMGGFSHGAAGIGAALAVLAERLDEPRARVAAARAWAFDRALYDPQDGAWRDLRAEDVEVDPVWPYPVQWCHGAGGIGLSRLLGLRADPADASLAQEAAQALDVLAEHGFDPQGSDCLCHGAFGNLEVFAVASSLLPAERDRRAAADRQARLAAVAVSRLAGRQPACGVSPGVQTPGLMLGVAGVGYGLLRVLRPDLVPSVLALQPPVPSLVDDAGPVHRPWPAVSAPSR